MRRWALNKNKEVGLNNFNASETWKHNFKKASHIVYREITKCVTRSYSEERRTVSTRASNFVEIVLRLCGATGP